MNEQYHPYQNNYYPQQQMGNTVYQYNPIIPQNPNPNISNMFNQSTLQQAQIPPPFIPQQQCLNQLPPLPQLQQQSLPQQYLYQSQPPSQYPPLPLPQPQPLLQPQFVIFVKKMYVKIK